MRPISSIWLTIPFGAVPGTRFSEQLLSCLYDVDLDLQRDAAEAVRIGMKEVDEQIRNVLKRARRRRNLRSHWLRWTR